AGGADSALTGEPNLLFLLRGAEDRQVLAVADQPETRSLSSLGLDARAHQRGRCRYRAALVVEIKADRRRHLRTPTRFRTCHRTKKMLFLETGRVDITGQDRPGSEERSEDDDRFHGVSLHHDGKRIVGSGPALCPWRRVNCSKPLGL